MGFSITIGQAEEIATGDSEVPSYFGVRAVERDDAPAFDSDEHTGHSNVREYSATSPGTASATGSDCTDSS